MKKDAGEDDDGDNKDMGNNCKEKGAGKGDDRREARVRTASERSSEAMWTAFWTRHKNSAARS